MVVHRIPRHAASDPEDDTTRKMEDNEMSLLDVA